MNNNNFLGKFVQRLWGKVRNLFNFSQGTNNNVPSNMNHPNNSNNSNNSQPDPMPPTLPVLTQPVYQLTTTTNTVFQELNLPTEQLTTEQKVRVNAGQSFLLNKYAIFADYIYVELVEAIEPIGKFGYFPLSQIQLNSRGNSQVRTFIFASSQVTNQYPRQKVVWVKRRTLLKRQPVEYGQLLPVEQRELTTGEVYLINHYAYLDDHIQVEFATDLADWGKSGYLPADQVMIFDQGQPQNLLPNKSISVIEDTVLQREPVDPNLLAPDDQYMLTAGSVYPISDYRLEDGYYRLVFPESLPQIGNIGYVQPDNIQLQVPMQPLNPVVKLTYQGAKVVVVNEPVTLRGTFDSTKGQNIVVLAEDKFNLAVTVDIPNKIWQVSLAKGFNTVGSRWLRVQNKNKQGQVVENLIINLQVSPNNLSASSDLQLTATVDTFFKVNPIDSAKLGPQQKVFIKAGQRFPVSKYGLVDGHLKVVLRDAIAPIGNFGYFYEPAVKISKGSQPLVFSTAAMPETTGNLQMLVTQKTVIKAQPVDSTSLTANQRADLPLGMLYNVTGYACIAGHFRVTFTENIPNFGNVGYIYWRHVQLKKGSQTIAFDPDALTMTMRETAVFKKSSADANQLSADNKVTLPMGRVYGVSSYAIEDNHLRASLTEEFNNFGNTGYILPAYVQMRRGGETFNPIPDAIELGVPHFSQRDNPRFYWSTCNVTSIAMVFYYYGLRSRWGGQLEDELLQWCFNNYGQGSQTDHSALAALIKAYGFANSSFSTTRNWSEIKGEIINRRPVVLAGNFTPGGHILTVIGYTPAGYLVNDPWGDALTGYSNTEGRRLIYPYDYMDQVAGPNGNVWAHIIRR